MKYRALLAALAVMVGCTIASTTAADATTSTVSPDADSYVQSSSPSSNFGANASLLVDGSSTTRVSYLRFPLPAAPAGETLTSAVLNVHTTTAPLAGSVDPQAVRTVGDDTWTETGITWNNRPAVGSQIGTINASAVDTAYSVTLDTAAVQAELGQELSLAVDETSLDNLYLMSRTGANPPTLDLTFAPSIRTFYVDCSAGSDSNDGLSSSTAWQTLAKASTATLNPGEQILLKRGCVWNEQLVAGWTGTATDPVVIGAYGTGANPTVQLNAGGTSTNDVDVLITGQYQTIQNLSASVAEPFLDSSCLEDDGSSVPVGWYVGFSLSSTANHNTLENLDGTALSAGVAMSDDTDHNLIRDSYFHDMHYLWRISKTSGALGSVGIVLHGDDNEFSGNLFERNLTECHYTDDGNFQHYGAPFEVYNANRNYVHDNQAFGHRKQFEMGHDTTHTTDDNVLAYNLFVSDYPGAVGPNIHNASNPFGPVNGTQVYNNTIVLTGADSQALVCSCSGGATVTNNILVAEWKAAYYSGTFTESGNVYWDYQATVDSTADPLVQFSSGSISPTSQKVDPLFVDPSSDFHLQANSPAAGAGMYP
jgi:hypothetical protein